ncbi:MAG TPA: hypothetical protein VN647_05755 [Nitrospira sp.]|nr:hypothetical protein [Nitrospira sp.]
MNVDEKKDQHLSGSFHQMERIDTQIHRRRKVKAFSPLESEWEASQAGRSASGDDEQSEEISVDA